MIFPTLAFQLAYRYPPFRQELLQVLRANPDVGREVLCSQMEKLIVGPFQTTKTQTLIIIDALDECQDKEPASALLSVLSRYVDKIPLVKFFITGRPEPRIRSGFRLAALRPHIDILRLHDVEPSLVDSDIKLFLKTQLANVVNNQSNCDLGEDWPGLHDLDVLCKKVAGFFIYAATVIKFVESQHHQPDERLTLITSLPQNTSHEGGSGLDLLYTQVLKQAFCDVNSQDHEFYSHLKSVVGAVLLVFNPFSVRTLSNLLRNCYTPSRISKALRPLHSLLIVPESMEDPVRIFHKSFPDFLTDPQRCTDEQFFVDPSVHHTELLLSCLTLMKGGLKKNICHLDDYAILSKVEDLSAQLKVYIGDALEYSCHFWANHLSRIPSNGPDTKEVQEAMDEFSTTHLLYWIEVLCLIGKLDAGVYALNVVQQWYISVSYKHSIHKSLCSYLIQAGLAHEWVDDSQCFILDCWDTIYDSPSHIYHSALPLSPSSSWLQKCYNSELSQEVKLVTGLSATWGTCSRTVSFHESAIGLVCWGNIVVVSLGTGSIIILDAVTGTHVSILSGHTNWVRSLTFSSDGTFLVSGSSDTTIKLWHIQTGGVIRTFSGHTDYIYSVSMSLDCATIASGSVDKTIRLWDVGTGECSHIIEGHTHQVNSVNFSKHPQTLISSSDDYTVRWWGIDGHQIQQAGGGPKVAFSSDGTHFISFGTTHNTVQNSDSGVMVAELPAVNGQVQSCCFSPDGKTVAGAIGSTIYLWDITGSVPHLVETFVGHTDDIYSLVFSSPSTLISASLDESVKFWQIGASPTDPGVANPESTPPAPASIKSVSLQSEDGFAFSSDSAGVVRMLDISTGTCKASFQTPCPKDINLRDTQLIDGRLIFVWCADPEVHVWDVSNDQLLRKIHPQYSFKARDLRISGDRSRVFYLDSFTIYAWSIWTGEVVGKVELESIHMGLTLYGTKVWVHSEGSPTQGWDFGIPGSSPVLLPNISSDRPCLDFVDSTKSWNTGLSRVEDTATGKVVFHLFGKYEQPSASQWDGQYLIAAYESEVLILDFLNVIPQ